MAKSLEEQIFNELKLEMAMGRIPEDMIAKMHTQS